MTEEQQAKYKPDWRWNGRSLDNYKTMHPKAREADTLTEARKLAFGIKNKSNSCKCGLLNCARSSGKKSSHC